MRVETQHWIETHRYQSRNRQYVKQIVEGIPIYHDNERFWQVSGVCGGYWILDTEYYLSNVM